MKPLSAAVLAVLALLSSAGAPAQTPPAQPPTPPPLVLEGVDVNVVSVTAVIFDKSGHFVPSLGPKDVELFDVRYLDPLTGLWQDSWDTTQLTGQLNRLPLEVKVTLVLKPVKNSPPYRFVTKFMLPMQQALSFGIPR